MRQEKSVAKNIFQEEILNSAWVQMGYKTLASSHSYT